MFCPVCEAEYESGITRCADDGAELVERLTTEAGAHDDSEARFIPLHTLSSPAEAEMVNDILQQNGIRCVVQSGASDAFSPLFSVMSPCSQVLVDGRDLDRAVRGMHSYDTPEIVALPIITASEPYLKWLLAG